ncbi:hypothetical protein Dthio_PD2130 [Desulfonatronospira thiodismutans ASO3-1]|uniref:Uncharacterized protein n=1 Tax=Desulfonatronospira thiodismutans ASO3-1 TaxID=555779 RepID=D6SPS8_9BACT|nr:hypothetical protein [Desulfonatronospira thiodismutans]EFI34754.1 hypothetical protein Dthio_PD2130 [Desulfonatronospira thiodismutans ASO3-1]
MDFKSLGQELIVRWTSDSSLFSRVRSVWNWNLPLTMYYHPDRARQEELDICLKKARIICGGFLQICPYNGSYERVLLRKVQQRLKHSFFKYKRRYVVRMFAEVVILNAFAKRSDYFADWEKLFVDTLDIEYLQGTWEYKVRKEIYNWIFDSSKCLLKSDMDSINFSENSRDWPEAVSRFADSIQKFIQSIEDKNKKVLKSCKIETRGSSSHAKSEKIKKELQTETLEWMNNIQKLESTAMRTYKKGRALKKSHFQPLTDEPWVPGAELNWLRPVLVPWEPYFFPSTPDMHIDIPEKKEQDPRLVLILDKSGSMLEMSQSRLYYSILETCIRAFAEIPFTNAAAVNFARNFHSSGWLDKGSYQLLQKHILSMPDPEESNFPGEEILELVRSETSEREETVCIIFSDGIWLNKSKELSAFFEGISKEKGLEMGMIVPETAGQESTAVNLARKNGLYVRRLVNPELCTSVFEELYQSMSRERAYA